jgi:thiamine-phosphate pyrophosphorylase
MEGFFSAGLERYHVRKPSWASAALESWLGRLPRAWRPRIILHQHHSLAAKLGLGGAHDRDQEVNTGQKGCSRSCHDVGSLRRHLPQYGSILFGPVFPSLTKPGYGPVADFPWDQLKSVLRERTQADARVLAIGGVTSRGLARCRELGFDGAAVLGAIWNERDPAAAYVGIRDAAARLEAERHAA